MNQKQEIENIKKLVERSGFREIVEITYAYKILGNDKYWNKTLFDEYTDCEQFVGKKYNEIYAHICSKIVETITELKNAIIVLENYSSDVQYKILQGYLEYAMDMFEIALIGLPFELEKAGRDHGLDENMIREVIIQIGSLEEKRFGKKICEDMFESTRVIKNLHQLVEKYEDRITHQEKKDFLGLLDRMKLGCKYNEEYPFEEDPVRHMDDDPTFQVLVERDKYAEIFRECFRFYGIDKGVTIDQRSTMYDGIDGLHIPDHGAYQTLTRQRIIELIQHEIEVHYLIQENMNHSLLFGEGANSLFKEEGLAKFLEEYINGAELGDFDISPSLYQMLAAEILECHDFKKFASIYWKLRLEDGNAEGYLLRRKRNYSLFYPGTQHKDISYSRGRFQIRGWLLNGGSFMSLFFAKVSFDDIRRLETFLPEDIKQKMIFPLFVAERVLFHFHDRTSRQFDVYLKEKYNFIDWNEYPSLQLSSNQLSSIEHIIKLFTV